MVRRGFRLAPCVHSQHGVAEDENADDASMTSEHFAHVVALNEAGKLLTARSFRVNLIALDAMVQSKRVGDTLRGFDEVSSQMRTWSQELQAMVERLNILSRQVVTEVSHSAKQSHTLRLLRLAAANDGRATLREALVVREADRDAQRRMLKKLWRQVNDCVDELSQLGMMAMVLSRAAMIEAASAPVLQLEQLAGVSREFARNSEGVVSELKVLSHQVKRVR